NRCKKYNLYKQGEKELNMKEKLIKTLDLENGLQLNIYDASRMLVGDRWLVSLIVRMDVPVTETLKKVSRQPIIKINEIRDILGDSVLFEKKREKIFIDTAEKETAFKELCDMFLNSSLNYLSKDIFPKQYVLKTYEKEVKKISWLNASRGKG
ncbi:MAG: hypothetical protein WAL93_03135, partial [Desulfobacterales bacterium]